MGKFTTHTTDITGPMIDAGKPNAKKFTRARIPLVMPGWSLELEEEAISHTNDISRKRPFSPVYHSLITWNALSAGSGTTAG